jgi:DNA-directed RNA polymerase specialized sigma24 family protein
MSDWSRFKSTETEVLIEYFQNAGIAEDIRNDAFCALCVRFREDLIKKCIVVCKRRKYDVDVAYDIANTTFSKYEKSRSFKFEKGSSDCIDDCFRFYLYKIAANELRDYYRTEEKRKKGLLYDGSETIITGLDINPDKLDPESRIIHEKLMSLPYSHRVIYLTYLTHSKNGVNLPRKLQAELREHLGGISQVTVRGYNKIAIEAIEYTKQVIKTIKNIER